MTSTVPAEEDAAGTVPWRPVSVVGWGACDCPTPAPPADPMADLVLVVAQGDAQVWAGPERVHPCEVAVDDRAFLVRSDLGDDVWLTAGEFAFDAFFAPGSHASVRHLHAALLDVGRWFDLPDREEDGGAALEDPGVLVTEWAPMGLSPAQAAVLHRHDCDPADFGPWVDLGTEHGWSVHEAVEWIALFHLVDQARPWVEAGFRDADTAEQWAGETTLSPWAALYLYDHGGGVDTAVPTCTEIDTHLRASMPCDDAGRVTWTRDLLDVRDDAVVLRSLVEDLSVERAVLLAQAGMWDPHEVGDLMARDAVDFDEVRVLAALRG